MKIYETSSAPNARRVRIFLAEKNIPMEYIQVDIVKGENLSADFLRKNPTGKIPVLELDDGTHIGESVAICRYFEELYPEIPLMGTTAQEKAVIEMWQRRVELHFLFSVGMCFQHVTGYFKDRMNPIKEWGEEAGKQALGFMKLLDTRLADSPYVAGETFSIADITALCAMDFARVVKLSPKEDQTNLLRWHKQVSDRPSAGA
ncbi:MAG: glutathione S-transferase [Exilibacterium sp.]